MKIRQKLSNRISTTCWINIVTEWSSNYSKGIFESLSGVLFGLDAWIEAIVSVCGIFETEIVCARGRTTLFSCCRRRVSEKLNELIIFTDVRHNSTNQQLKLSKFGRQRKFVDESQLYQHGRKFTKELVSNPSVLTSQSYLWLTCITHSVSSAF